MTDTAAPLNAMFTVLAESMRTVFCGAEGSDPFHVLKLVCGVSQHVTRHQ